MAAGALTWLLIGLNTMRIAQQVFGWGSLIDLRFPLQAWVPADAFVVATVVSPSAIAFLLVSIPLLLPRNRAAALFHTLVLLSILLSRLSMGRYLYGGQPLLALAQMSIPTSAFQLVASVAVLCLRPESGLVSLLLAPTAGGLLMRRLLVPALVLPPFFGWLRLAGEQAGLYGPEAGLTLFAYSNVILFAALVWSAAAWLNRTDNLREAAERNTRNQLERMSLLQQVTRATAERQDPGSIFQVAVRSLEDRLPVDFGGIWLLEDGNSKLKQVHSGMKSKALEADPSRPAIDAAGLDTCLAGHLVYEPDVRQLASPFPRHLAALGMRAVVLVPLQAESRVFGLMVVARARPASFTSGECEFLTQLSTPVALASFQAELHSALERAYLDLRETQQSALERDRLRALGEMASGIAHDINNSISPAALHLESMLERGDADERQGAASGSRSCSARCRTPPTRYRACRSSTATATPPQQGFISAQPAGRAGARPDPLEMARRAPGARPCGRGDHRPGRRPAGDPRQRKRDPRGLDQPGAQRGRRDARGRPARPADPGLRPSRRSPRRAWGRRKLVALEVKDSGVGMDEETKRRCFEPFFTTKGERGSGLGLPMVFGVAERHGATVEIESEPGQGTTIRMVFPALAGRNAAPEGRGQNSAQLADPAWSTTTRPCSRPWSKCSSPTATT